MPQSERKPKCREAFKDFLAHRDLDLGELKEKERSRVFAQFYVDKIYNPQHQAIGDDDFDNGWVDNSGDLGADFIHRDNGTVVILQAKYAKEKIPSSQGDIEYFRNLMIRLQDKSFTPNRECKKALDQIDWKNDRFVCHFITLANLGGQARIIAESPLPGSGVPADRIDVRYLDEGDLNDELRKAETTNKPSTATVTLSPYGKNQKDKTIIELNIAGHPSYVLVVTASQLADLYHRGDVKEALFSLNIRHYLGTTKVNAALMETARSTPELFFHLNNGISCIATAVTVEGNSLSATGLQVVNGAQTVRCLVNARKHSGSAKAYGDDEPTVLMRITVASKGYGAEGHFKESIVRANNTQNPIKASDHRSNDPIQRDLAKQFEGYKRQNKSVVYLPKRTDPREIRHSYVIHSQDFAKTVFSFIGDPAKISQNSAMLFDDGEKGLYQWVFGSGDEPWNAMPLLEFKLRSAIWWMADEFSRQLKTDRANEKDAIRVSALREKVWILCAARIILQQCYGEESYKEKLAEHYKGKWTIGKDAENNWTIGQDTQAGKWFANIYDYATTAVKKAYRRESEKGGQFFHRNWLRNASTMKAIQVQITDEKDTIHLDR